MCLQKRNYEQQSSSAGVPSPYALLSLIVASLTSYRVGRLVSGAWLGRRATSTLPLAFTNDCLLATHDTIHPNWTVNREINLLSYEDTTQGEEGDDLIGMNTLNSIRHLLVDLEGVPEELIASDAKLEKLMDSVEELCGASLLAQTCTSNSFADWVTCVGIFEDRGHISIHAWPGEGVALLDLQLADDDLIDMVDDIIDLFHSNIQTKFDSRIAFSNPVEPSTWQLRPRVSTEYFDDLADEMALSSQTKYKVASKQTKFQQIDVVEFHDRQTRVDLENFRQKDPEYIERNPHLFAPDRVLYLDGIMQSASHGNAAYHEALVQPSMFAHPNPKRVAIIGGGECATLREVLKHNTVEKVVMIEIDPDIIEISKHALPDWNDCSNFEGSSRYCMDDPRAEIQNEDAFKWFIDRYLRNADAIEEPLFDVIIMDALDPQNVVEFAEALYGDESFLKALYRALTKDGILITQVGEAPWRTDPPEQFSLNKNRLVYANSLINQGFQSIADYIEDHAEFDAPWYFYAAFKNLSTRTNWMANEAEINLSMKKRAIRTRDGQTPFHFFDGATMKAYQYPTRASVMLFCRRTPTPPDCQPGVHGFNPETPNFSEAHFYVAASKAGEYAGRGVFAKTLIPVGSYLMLEASVHPVIIEASSAVLIENMSNYEIADEYNIEELTAFVWGYGYSSQGFGDANIIEVDSGILTFVNHGCNGSSNLGLFPKITDSSVNQTHVPNELLYYRNQGVDYVFNPAAVRSTFSRVENQNVWGDIKAGDELLENYYEQFAGRNDWKENVDTLNKYCSGGIGEVEKSEREAILYRQASDNSKFSGDIGPSLASSTAEISTLGVVEMVVSS